MCSHVIKNMDREWFSVIKSINHMSRAEAGCALTEIFDNIGLLFGIPKKVFNDEKVLVTNPLWVDAKKWVEWQAGWVVTPGGVFKHPVRVLQEKFVLNGDVFK